jgi:hypothetical protein
MARQGSIPGEGFASGGARPIGHAIKWVDKCQPDYWSGTELNPGNNAWNFNFDNGDQNDDNENNNNFAWAVRPG